MSKPTTASTDKLQYEPGKLYDVGERAYRSHPGINFSTLKGMARSPQYYQYLLAGGFKPTASMSLGTAVHSLVLTPDAFDEEVAVTPEVNRRTNAGKETIKAFEAENKGKAIVTQEEYDRAQAMRDAVMNDEHASAALGLAPLKEHMALWMWENGPLCKAKIDAHGEDTIVDLKTTADASIGTIRNRLTSFHYDAQLAFYAAGLKACGIELKRHIFVFVESAAPHGVTVVELSPQWIELATGRIESWLTKVLDCTMNGKWEAGPGGVVYMEPPAWMLPS